MSIKLFVNAELNDGLVNVYDSQDRSQPEVIKFLKRELKGKTVVTDEYHEELLNKEGIVPKEFIVLDVMLGVPQAQIDNVLSQISKDIVVYGSSEVYEPFFNKAVSISMMRHHTPMRCWEFLPEFKEDDWKVENIKKLKTNKKYNYDMSEVLYSRKLRIVK